MRSAITFAALSLYASLVGCAAPTASDATDGDASETEDAVVASTSTCSRASYDAAFAKYRSAVEHAKARNSGGICDDGTTLGEIANELAGATATCADFRQIIATSKWAQPVRDALKNNLALAVLGGKLEMRDARGKVTFRGLADALPGTTLFGPAPGVYGNMSKVTFAAGGKAKVSRLDLGDGSSSPTWKDSEAKWSIGAIHGDSIDLTISVGAKSMVYVLRASADADLTFVPKTGDEILRAMPSECEA